MINFERFRLENGLTVLVHKDASTPVIAMNILYDVGAKDEKGDKTGFAHLFEHLMFGGSINIPKYDEPLQKVGGENNAFTSNDITNYYITVPKQNLETAFWLESDRMLDLAFSTKSLAVQKNVVIEEFKQVFLNQPYGDAWLELRPLAYKAHPYRWSTIGQEISHIEDAKMQDVKAFYKKYYNPNNAILTIAGDVELEEIKRLSEKWFGIIPKGVEHKRNIPKEPRQLRSRKKTMKRDVPVNAIYKAYHMCARTDLEYHATDLLSDIVSNGDSSRLYQELVKTQHLFSELNAFITGDIENGLFIISGKLTEGTRVDEAEKAIKEELKKLKSNSLKEEELLKVKNKIESSLIFSEMSVLNKAMNLSHFELLGDAHFINSEIDKYLRVGLKDIKAQAKSIFKNSNCSTLYYLAKNGTSNE
jgi:zinc protease